jgi:hypothetical protein
MAQFEKDQQYVLVKAPFTGSKPPTPSNPADNIAGWLPSPPPLVRQNGMTGEEVKSLTSQSATQKAPARGKLGIIRVLLANAVASIGSSSSAQFPVDTLTPSGVPEFSSYAALYDEFRTVGVHVRVNVSNNAASSTPIEWGFAFDPMNNGPYTAPYQVLVASQRKYGILGDASGGQTMQQVTTDGCVHLKCRIPKGPTGATQVGTPIGNNWAPVSATAANLYCGYLKYAIDAPNAGNTTLTRTYVYLVEFRSRS